MTLGETIVSLRSAKGWSQGDLAEALEVSRQSVSKWELDASVPELEKLLKLSDLFGVTLDTLVRGEEAPDETAHEPRQPAPQTVPADFSAQPPPASPRRHTTAGVILLCTGFVLFALFLLLGGGIWGLICAFPLLLCGIICLAAKKRTGLWCAWAVYLCVDFYLRYATGLSWSAVRLSHLWTAEMNYMRLLVAWVQFLSLLAMIGATLFSYRKLCLAATKKRLLLLALGWVAALVLLPLLMNDVLAPLLYLSPYRPLGAAYSYLRLTLITLLSVRSLAVWRAWRTKKKAAR